MDSPDFIPDSQFTPDPPSNSPTSQPTDSKEPDFIPDDQFQSDNEKFGTPIEQGKTLVEGIGRGLIPFGGSTAAETAILHNAPEQLAREKANPATSLAGEIAGFAGPAVATFGTSALGSLGLGVAEKAAPLISAASKFSQAGILEKIAQGLTGTVGITGESGVASKIGSMAVKGAIENAGFQSGDEISKQILSPDPSGKAISSAMYDIGGASLLGFGVGGTFGAVSPLWKAAFGPATNGTLDLIADKVGGINGIESDLIDKILTRAGLEDVPSEIKASLSDNPEIKRLSRVLSQSDTTKSGKNYQKTLGEFKEAIDNHIVQSLGKDPSSLTGEFSESEQGKQIGLTLSNELKTISEPISKGYNEAAEKYGSAPLGDTLVDKSNQAQDLLAKLSQQFDDSTAAHYDALANGKYEEADSHLGLANDLGNMMDTVNSAKDIPGVKDSIGQNLANLVQQEKWLGSDDIMKEVNRVMKRIPDLADISDLQGEMKTIGNNTASTLPFGQQTPLSRAGALIKNVFRDAESTALSKAIGEKEGVEALNQFKANSENFKALASLKDSLDRRLRIGGSVTGYYKGVASMADEAPEKILRKLSGKGDADILNVLQDSFPQTAEAVKGAYIDRLLSRSYNASKGESTINGAALLKQLFDPKNTSPELRNFAVSPESLDKLSHLSNISERLSDQNYNFSNTARTLDALMSHLPGTAAGLVAGLVTGNPLALGVVGAMVKPIAKDIPDAIKLGTLRFLGTSKPINGSAFKMMTDFIHSAQKGENLITHTVSNLFKGAGEVLSSSAVPTVIEREKLDKRIDSIKKDPSQLFSVGKDLGHYMPQEASALSATAARISNYLNQIKPRPVQLNPFDKPIEPTQAQKIEYDHALNVAIQPLSVLPKIKDGTLVPSDMNHLKSMYPNAYTDMAQRVMTQMSDAITKGEKILYRTRQSLSLFLGETLDPTMSPQSIQAIQAIYGPNPPKPTPQPNASNRKKGSTQKLGKISENLQTPDQSRTSRLIQH